MQINEAIGLLDKYFSSGVSDEAIAWERIRKELVEGQKPSTNSAMDAILTLYGKHGTLNEMSGVALPILM